MESKVKILLFLVLFIQPRNRMGKHTFAYLFKLYCSITQNEHTTFPHFIFNGQNFLSLLPRVLSCEPTLKLLFLLSFTRQEQVHGINLCFSFENDFSWVRLFTGFWPQKHVTNFLLCFLLILLEDQGAPQVLNSNLTHQNLHKNKIFLNGLVVGSLGEKAWRMAGYK